MKALKNMQRWFINIALVAALLLAAAVWLPGAFHMKAYVVKSSSMEPTIKAGSVIYVKPYGDNESVSAGDIISFHTGKKKTCKNKSRDLATELKSWQPYASWLF